MYILPLFIILLPLYTSIAGNISNAESISSVYYDAEDGINDEVLTAKVEPDNECKTSKFIDEDTSIYCIRKGDKYVFINFCYPEDEDESVTVTFKYSFGPSGGMHEFSCLVRRNGLMNVIMSFYSYFIKNMGVNVDGNKTEGGGIDIETFDCYDPIVTKEYKNVSIDNLHLDIDVDDQGELVMSSFLNKQGIRIRTYASRVENPKGHIILVHNLRSHFRSSFCRYNLEWYEKYVGDFIDSNGRIVFDGELNDIFPDLTSLKKDGTVHEDLLHGMNAFDTTPRFLYEGSFVQLFNKLGYSVYGLDLQSHGLSGGVCKQRCYVDDFDDFALDVMQFVSIVKRGRFDDPTEVWDEELVYKDIRYDDGQYHLCGLSLGATIALKAQVLFSIGIEKKTEFVDSLISINPMLMFKQLRGIKNFILTTVVKLTSILAPKRGIAVQIMDNFDNGVISSMRFNVS